MMRRFEIWSVFILAALLFWQPLGDGTLRGELKKVARQNGWRAFGDYVEVPVGFTEDFLRARGQITKESIPIVTQAFAVFDESGTEVRSLALCLERGGTTYFPCMLSQDDTAIFVKAAAEQIFKRNGTVQQLDSLNREIRLAHKETMSELNEQLIEPLATVELCRMELERPRPEPTDEEIHVELDKLWK